VVASTAAAASCPDDDELPASACVVPGLPLELPLLVPPLELPLLVPPLEFPASGLTVFAGAVIPEDDALAVALGEAGAFPQSPPFPFVPLPVSLPQPAKPIASTSGKQA
jgi:hypothetical protein